MPLNRKHLRNDTRSSLSITVAALLNVFGVLSRNDVFARLGMVHDGFGVREETIEGPVEDASGDERVDVSDRETVKVDMLV